MSRWDGGPAMSPLADAPVTLSCLLLGHDTDPRGITTCTGQQGNLKQLCQAKQCHIQCHTECIDATVDANCTCDKRYPLHVIVADMLKSQQGPCNRYVLDYMWHTHKQQSSKEMLTLPLNQTSFSSSAKAMYQATAAVQTPM